MTLECTELFLIKGNRILLARKKRGFGEGKWIGVGGKIEPGETAEEAMVRECQEEIGVTPTIYEKVADVTAEELHDDKRKYVHIHAYIARQWNGEPIETDEMLPAWYEIEDIPYRHMWPDSAVWMPKVLKGSRVKGSFTLDDKDRLIASDLKVVKGF